jgi:hypothetical protein
MGVGVIRSSSIAALAAAALLAAVPAGAAAKGFQPLKANL